ncbi:class I SAM-dependent methyltransferase [Streptomyces sp. NBC_00536]|uniref:SAM-dependent methyltransferase n=1 Tax=Streptomyces sp. NBC_00536 TaxID=2975769 RepID=UPI002E811A94|nr:class I SAM-dependent methyltransferase [Streptomyces sp. NBC_00536]WUC83994.1 class I SAM-dependent methyltransferase [Streptomyces sp. NBC_00536]
MNREQISRIAHTRHPIKSPLDDASVQRLLEHGVAHGQARLLDLGCGTAEWLLRALSAHPEVRAEGVDVSTEALEQASEAARARGVQDRLVLHQQEAAAFTAPHTFDLILNVGSSHAFGGLLPTLDAAAAHLAPGGRVLIGDAFWEREPSPEAVEMLGEYGDLATTLDQITAAGWTPVHAHVSTRQELDAYEWALWGTLADWALDHPEDPDSAQALETAAERRSEWLHTYRDSFGFLSLVLRRTAG